MFRIIATFLLILINFVSIYTFADGGSLLVPNPQKIGDWWTFNYQDPALFSRPTTYGDSNPALKWVQLTEVSYPGFYSTLEVRQCVQGSFSSPQGTFKNC